MLQRKRPLLLPSLSWYIINVHYNTTMNELIMFCSQYLILSLSQLLPLITCSIATKTLFNCVCLCVELTERVWCAIESLCVNVCCVNCIESYTIEVRPTVTLAYMTKSFIALFMFSYLRSFLLFYTFYTIFSQTHVLWSRT